MKELQVETTLNLDNTDNIKSIEDKSEGEFKRIRIHFNNGCQLSIVRGNGTYGFNNGLFEIAPLNKDGKIDGSLFDKEDQDEDVLGYCDEDKINYYINKIGDIK